MKKLSVWLALAGWLTLSAAHATTITEKFAANPLLNGWQIFGDTNLFQWDSTNQDLDVTWDSSQTNSYYYYPLGQTLTTNDSFCVLFDLQLKDATVSDYGSELSVGLLNFSDATNVNFSRTDATLPNVFEFDYFPADDYGDPPSIDASLVDTATNFYFVYDNQPLNPGVTYHVLLLHTAGTSTISGEVFTNGQVMSSLPIVYAGYPVGDSGAFQLDTVAISSYAGDGFGDSILAHGTVANLAVATPLPVGTINAIAAGQVQFVSDTNWLYTLEQTTNFQAWSVAAPSVPGTVTNLVLQATNLPVSQSFYRVSANLK
ncbi:MAG: hypothetical protein ABSF34_03660 [Verrucomicrobiota bacterium]